MKRFLTNLAVLLLLVTFTYCQKNGSNSNRQQYRFNGTMNVDERARTYLLNLPPHYYDNDSTAFALVLGLHGGGGSAAQFEKDYHFTDKANAAGFIALYPNGIQSSGPLGLRTWNAGTCCDAAMEQNVDDVKFIRELIDYVISHYHVNPKKVYVTGMSNGAMMSYRLACELSDKIAAIAPVSGTLVTTKSCTPVRAVPILHIHSILDQKVPYAGGIGLAGYYYPPVDSGLELWAGKNACSTKQVVTDDDRYKLTQWTSCTNNVMMQLYLTKDGGHAWPGSQKVRAKADTPSTVINANDVIWDFFQRYTL